MGQKFKMDFRLKFLRILTLQRFYSRPEDRVLSPGVLFLTGLDPFLRFYRELIVGVLVFKLKL